MLSYAKLVGTLVYSAKNAVTHGNHPFGTLLVHEGTIVATFENETTLRKKNYETNFLSFKIKEYFSPLIKSTL